MMYSGVFVFFFVIILVIVLGERTKINYGIFAFAFSFILGAIWCKMSPKAVIGLFPVSIFFNMFIATAFYGFANVNGTLKVMSGHIMYAFRGAKKLAPLTLFAAGYIIALCGADTAATTIFMCPIAFGMAANMGFNPALAALLTWTGAISGTRAPWGVQAVTMSGLFGAGFDETIVAAAMSKMFFKISIWAFLIAVIGFLILKGYKTEGTMDYKKPDPMDKEQKITIFTILLVAALLIVPALLHIFSPNPVTAWMKAYLTIQSLSALGMVVLSLTKAADPTVVLKTRVPWTTIVMVCGMSMLIGLASAMGVVNVFSAVLTSDSLPTWAILPILCLICSILSFFVSGMVVIPMLMSFLPVLAAQGISPVSIIPVVVIGLSAASISPFSEGGAIIVGCCEDEMLSRRLVNKMMMMALVIILFTVVLSATGFFSF